MNTYRRGAVRSLLLAGSLLAAAFAAPTAVSAAPPVASRDIFGVRLYDSSDEVLAKIRAIDPRNLSLSAYDHPKTVIATTKCVPARTGTNGTYLKRCPGTISFTTSKFVLTTEMVEDLPERPGRMRAYSVTLQSRSLGADFVDLTPVTLEKYGPPDLRRENVVSYCARRAEGAPTVCRHDEPSLILTDGQTLVLADFGFQAAKLQAATSHLPDIREHTLRF